MFITTYFSIFASITLFLHLIPLLLSFGLFQIVDGVHFVRLVRSVIHVGPHLLIKLALQSKNEWGAFCKQGKMYLCISKYSLHWRSYGICSLINHLAVNRYVFPVTKLGIVRSYLCQFSSDDSRPVLRSTCVHDLTQIFLFFQLLIKR